MNKNYLINSLPKKTQSIFFSKSELIELKLSQITCLVDHPTEFLFFPVDGFISITQRIDDHASLEVGMIGREGVLGSEVILGINSNPFGAIVQGAGNAWKISAQEFLNEVDTCREFHKVMCAYISVRLCQLSLSVACEHFHEIGPRLAKWLLMSQDRAQSPIFLMTHEFISLVLGVRRVGVTTSAFNFKQRGLIEYTRGEMRVLDRKALMLEACSCYQRNRRIFSAFIQ